jgi:hypothetical protein
MDEENKVESGIPIPKKGKTPRYPALYTMEVGQSFARPHAEGNTLHYAAQHCNKVTKRRFTVRYPDEKTVRVWRIL